MVEPGDDRVYFSCLSSPFFIESEFPMKRYSVKVQNDKTTYLFEISAQTKYKVALAIFDYIESHDLKGQIIVKKVQK